MGHISDIFSEKCGVQILTVLCRHTMYLVWALKGTGRLASERLEEAIIFISYASQDIHAAKRLYK